MEEEEENDKEQRNRYTNMYESACIYVCASVRVWYAEAQKRMYLRSYIKFSVLS